MNNGLSDLLKLNFPNVISVERPKLNLSAAYAAKDFIEPQ